MQNSRMVTHKDGLIRRLLQDPLYKVTAAGEVLTRLRPRGGRRGACLGPWRRAGWVSPSRAGSKIYRRIQYCGEELYEHRIVYAAVHGKLCPFKTVNHKDVIGTNNNPKNLELITPRRNAAHARDFYRRTGLSAAEARANWIAGGNSSKDSNWRGQHEATDSHGQT